jgi:branched-chain amino acid transport system substrate-binding protein
MDVHDECVRLTTVTRELPEPEVELMGLTYTLDELRVEQSPDAYEGVRFSSAFKTFDEALETDRAGDAIEEMFENRSESLDDREVANLNYVRGMIHALIMFKGIENAVEAGDLDPTEGADLRQGLFRIDGRDAWGLIGPIAYAENDRRPTMTGRIYQVQDGDLVHDESFELPRREEWIAGSE